MPPGSRVLSRYGSPAQAPAPAPIEDMRISFIDVNLRLFCGTEHQGAGKCSDAGLIVV
ncbi:unnamed protein product [Ectocarpus sp. 13 AM-2016]